MPKDRPRETTKTACSGDPITDWRACILCSSGTNLSRVKTHRKYVPGWITFCLRLQSNLNRYLFSDVSSRYVHRPHVIY